MVQVCVVNSRDDMSSKLDALVASIANVAKVLELIYNLDCAVLSVEHTESPGAGFIVGWIWYATDYPVIVKSKLVKALGETIPITIVDTTYNSTIVDDTSSDIEF